MKRTVCLLLLVAFALSAYCQDDYYPIGINTYLYDSSRHTFNQAVGNELREMNFNTALVNEWNNTDSDFQELTNLYNDLSSPTKPMHLFVQDRNWDKNEANFNHYSSQMLTLSNYWNIEAEYSDENDVVQDDKNADKWWYASRSDNINNVPLLRVGSFLYSDGQYSNDYCWKCVSGTDLPGYAFTNLVQFQNLWVSGFTGNSRNSTLVHHKSKGEFHDCNLREHII